jgi:hydroxymethylpyrimidine pyrophosphatase-like HAD family hydrolase
VVSNGALVWDVAADAPHLVRELTPSTGRAVCRDLRAAVPGTTYAVESLAGISLEEAFVQRHPKPPGSRIAPADELLDAPALKILARHESMDPEEFWQRALEVVGARATATISTTRTALVEISAAGVTKASTLALVAETLGVDPAGVVAFGDMPNDLPMLTWAGTSYAMAGGHPSVLEVADHVAPDHDDDGVAQVLEELYGLG